MAIQDAMVSENLNVQIVNKTNSECLYQGYKMIQGQLVYISTNDIVIPANATHSFSVQQHHLYGPTIIVDYLCNGKKISLGSHQNLCLLKIPGNIEAKVINQDVGIQAKYKTIIGEPEWSQPGQIYLYARWKFRAWNFNTCKYIDHQ